MYMCVGIVFHKILRILNILNYFFHNEIDMTNICGSWKLCVIQLHRSRNILTIYFEIRQFSQFSMFFLQVAYSTKIIELTGLFNNTKF